MRDPTYTPVNNEGALVKVPSGRRQADYVICTDRVVEHVTMSQRTDYGRYRKAGVLFKDVEEVRRDRTSVFLYVGEGRDDSRRFWFDKARPTQAFEYAIRAGIEAFHGDKRAAKEFNRRVDKLQEQHGTDATVYVWDLNLPVYDHERRKEHISTIMQLTTPKDGERLVRLLKDNPTSIPSEEIRDVSRELPPMLEANWNLDKGCIQLGYSRKDPDVAYDRDRWTGCHMDGFHYGYYALDESWVNRVIAEAVQASRIVYIEDRRTHSNIKYLRGLQPLMRGGWDE